MKIIKYGLIVLGFVLFYIAAIMLFDPTADPTGYFIGLLK